MRHLIIMIYAWWLDFYKRPLMLSEKTIKFLFIPGFDNLRAYNSKVKAYAEFIKAQKNVPAYKHFLESQDFSKPSFHGITPNIHEIPFTDKINYVNKYSMDSRCVNGKIPAMGVAIDESSGSSGTATNWARGKKERKRNARMIKFAIRNLLGKDPLFIINAFALGPWATGVNVTMSCMSFSKLKSLGPDKIKIENTIKQFGKDHHYLIMGYPPFLKMLVDDSDVNWSEHNVTFIFGGESMSEGMRDYLTGKGIKRIYSSLGASDLELNMAGENNFTISLRRLLASNKQLQEKIIKYQGALPMVFQYNPSDFLFETSESGDLIVTICRPDYIAPKIRYNIRDRGHVLQMKELYTALQELNIKDDELVKPQTDLPILLHYGRSDATVSFFGANISPVDIHETLYCLPTLATAVSSFCIDTIENNEGSKQLIISIELQQGKNLDEPYAEQLQTTFFDQLAKTNQDFREARKMAIGENQMVVILYPFANGPFKNNDKRIKAQYINR